MKVRFSITWGTGVAAVAGMLLVVFALWGGMEAYTSQSSFCGGSCHTMEEQYTAWKNNTHHASKNADGKQAECIECHFLPGEKHGLKAKFEGLRHLAAYLYDPDAPLPIRPVIKDGACLQSGCHSIEKIQDTELKFSKKQVKFKHKVHFGDKALEGQKLTCDTCHFKVTADKHFEVPTDICFLCHLKLEKPTLEKVKVVKSVSLGTEKDFLRVSFNQRPTIDFNEGASRCEICHKIPTYSLQRQLSAKDSKIKAITHQTIQKAGVTCESCHFEVVKGHGEVDTGNVVSNGCLTCHNRSEKLLKTATDKKLMHDEHVAKHKADCFDCHSVVEHKNRTDHLDFVRTDCQLCHQDQHRFQKILLAGTPINGGEPGPPHLMYGVNVNCMACHLKKDVSQGHAVRKGAKETCAACHTEKHKQMLDDWVSQVDKEVKGVEEFEQEVMQAMTDAKEKFTPDRTKKIKAKLKTARDLLNIVRFGNGVHNKKYAITILDEAFGGFESAMELIEE